MNSTLTWLQTNSVITFIFGIFLLILIVFSAWKAGELTTRLRLNKIIREEREDAVKRSRAVTGGFAGEQMAAFLPEFPCNPADCRFVGKPIDYIGFKGASETDEISEILLIEVKTGESRLSRREKQVRDCVEKGRVKYVEYRIE